MLSVRRCLLLIVTALMLTMLVGCGQKDVRVKIGSLPVRIAFAAGEATLGVLSEEFIGVKIDS
jgi:hypothetical protein